MAKQFTVWVKIYLLFYTFVDVKCSELLRILRRDGWFPASQKGSHMKLKHDTKKGTIIFPNHGSQEIGKGLEKKIKKEAGL